MNLLESRIPLKKEKLSRDWLLRSLGMLAAATIALSGIGLNQAAPAEALVLSQQTWVNGNPSGAVNPFREGMASLDPVAVLEDGSPVVTTITSLDLISSPTTYGDVAVFTASVKLDGPINLSGQQIYFDVNGTTVAQSMLIYVGGGNFMGLLPFVSTLSAGTNTVVARFAGASDGDPATPDARPSTSEPLTVTINQAPTSTSIISTPVSTRAFTPIDVEAQVSALAVGLEGNAVLLANGSPLMHQDLTPTGTVSFDNVIVPWGTTELTVAYLGSTPGNFAQSSSQPIPFNVISVATETTMSVSHTEARADETVTVSAAVTHANSSTIVDPRGDIEILVDGEVAYTIPAGQSVDSDESDGKTEFEIDISERLLGVHTLSARFVPVPGFDASESGTAELRVYGIETRLVPSQTEIRVAPKEAVSVEMSVSVADSSSGLWRVAGPGDLVGGYVQAFIGSAPFGDPVDIVDGSGRLELVGLPVGSHEFELRFVPAEQGLLRSSAALKVVVGSESGAGGSGDTGRGNWLSSTGTSGPRPLIFGAAVLIVAAGAVFAVARRRQRR